MNQTTTNPCEQVLTIAEAARLVGRAPSTIRLHLLAGTLPGRCLEPGRRGMWIVDRAALLAYYRARPKDAIMMATRA